jgi:multicomponent Na+:H+ antiporter subunit F
MIEWINIALLGILGVAMLLAFIRLVRGPDLPNRVAALDLMVIIAVCMAAAYAALYSATVFLDVAIVLALVAFIATVALARYVESGAEQ